MSASNRTLFQISDDLIALDNLLDELSGDVSDEQTDAAIGAWFEQLGEERDQKLDNYAAFIRELEARAEARKTEAHRLAALVTTDTNRILALNAGLNSFSSITTYRRFKQRGFVSRWPRTAASLRWCLTPT